MRCRSARPRAIARLLLALLVASAVGGCDGGADGVVDAGRRVRAARVEAARVEVADPAAARALLQGTLDGLPAGGQAALTVLRQDLHFALGALELRADRAAEALAAADAGLALPRGPAAASLFVARLFALRGLALEALGRPDDAVTALTEAQAIHQQLFDQVLKSPPEENSP